LKDAAFSVSPFEDMATALLLERMDCVKKDTFKNSGIFWVHPETGERFDFPLF